jgi:aldose 1-epimerase
MAQRYSVNSEVVGATEIFCLSEDDQIRVQVAPAWGNNCFAFCLPEPVLEPVDFEELRQRPASYGIPILFPFPNRLRDGGFSFRGQRYMANPNRHGFVRNKAWEVLGTGASEMDGAWITSQIDASRYPDEILKQFPFPFRLQVTYRLRDAALEMKTVAQNTGPREMPLGFGIHPYFRCPERGTIQVPARKLWELSNSLPTGRLLDVAGRYDLSQPTSVAGLALDDIFTDLVPEEDRMIRCRLVDQVGGRQTVVEFDPAQFPNVVIYNPPAPRRSICIEPYSCPSDGFNLSDRGIPSNLIVLRGEESVTFDVRIYEG